jgi:glycolate oxidase FAD binding subunit
MLEFEPADLDEAAAAMQRTAREKLRVAFVGGGTSPAPVQVVDAVVCTRRMARILEYAPADMVLVAEAGVTLAQIQEATRAHGQMLALDPPRPERATVGGAVAAGAFGPRRARYGAIRDLIIGVTIVRADGVVGRGGGKVVKNVAGFDLPKIACGSLGTLGLVATATFRLHPLPEARATAWVEGVTAERVGALRALLRGAQLEPTSVVALRAGPGSFDVAASFEGFGRGVKEQVRRFAEDASAAGLGDEAAFRRRHDEARTGGSLRVRVGALPSRLGAVDVALAPLFAAMRDPAFAWYATLGLGFVAGEPREGAGAAIAAARAALVADGGWLVVDAAPDGVDPAVDRWGPPPAAFGIMRDLKARFDPERRLNPGCFVGGL